MDSHENAISSNEKLAKLMAESIAANPPVKSPPIAALELDLSRIKSRERKELAQQFIDEIAARILLIERWGKIVFDQQSGELIHEDCYDAINSSDEFYFNACNLIVRVMLQIKQDFPDFVSNCNLFNYVESEEWQESFKKNFHKIFIDRDDLTSSPNYIRYNGFQDEADLFYAQSFANAFGFMLSKIYIEFALTKENQKADITPEYILAAFKSFGQCLFPKAGLPKGEVTTGRLMIDYGTIADNIALSSEYGKCLFAFASGPSHVCASNLFGEEFNHEGAFLKYAQRYLEDGAGLVDDINIQENLAKFILAIDNFTHVFADANGRSAALTSFFLSINQNVSPIKTFYESASNSIYVAEGADYFAKFIQDPRVNFPYNSQKFPPNKYFLENYEKYALENFMIGFLGNQDIEKYYSGPAYFLAQNMREDLYISVWAEDESSGYSKIIGKSHLDLFLSGVAKSPLAINAEIVFAAIEANRAEIFDSLFSPEIELTPKLIMRHIEAFLYRTALFTIGEFVSRQAPFSKQEFKMVKELGKRMHAFCNKDQEAENIMKIIAESSYMRDSSHFLVKSFVCNYDEATSRRDILDQPNSRKAKFAFEDLKSAIIDLLDLKAEAFKSLFELSSKVLCCKASFLNPKCHPEEKATWRANRFYNDCEAIIERCRFVSSVDYSLENVKVLTNFIETDKYLSGIIKSRGVAKAAETAEPASAVEPSSQAAVKPSLDNQKT